MSKFHALSDAEIIASVEADATIYRVLSVDDREAFLILQFEPVDREADSEVWSRLKHELLAIGISDIRLHQVTESTEYQIFISLTKTYPLDALVSKLRRYLDSKGLDMVRLLLPEDMFVLPLQPGYRWMNDRVQPVVARRELSLEMALEYFVSAVTKSSICPDELNAQLDAVLDLCLDKVDVQVASGPDKDGQDEMVETGLDVQVKEPVEALRLVPVQAVLPEPAETETIISAWTPQVVSMNCLDGVQAESEDRPLGVVSAQREEEQAVQLEARGGIDLEESSIETPVLAQSEIDNDSPAGEYVEAKSFSQNSAASELEDSVQQAVDVELHLSFEPLSDNVSAELPVMSSESVTEVLAATHDEVPAGDDSSQAVDNVIPFQQLLFPFADGLIRPAAAQPKPGSRRRSKRAPPPE